MNSHSVIVCSQEQAAALREAVKEIPAAAWESFSYAPGESGAKPDPDRAVRYFQVTGKSAVLNAPLFEERYGLNPAAVKSQHFAKVGARLGVILELHPEDVLTGPRLTGVFSELHNSILAHQSSIAHE